MRLHLIAGWRRAWRLTSVQAAALLTLVSVLVALRNELLPLFQFAIPEEWWPWVTGIWGGLIVVLRVIAQPGVLAPMPGEDESYGGTGDDADTSQRGFISEQFLLLLACAVGGLVLGFLGGTMRANTACARKGTVAVVKAAKTAASATEATHAVAAQAAASQIEIRTVFKDRIIKEYVEVPREVVAKEDAACVVPARFVGMWNSANRAELPTFTGQLDAAPSGVALSDISAQHEREAELCTVNTEQLKALQAAERERQRVMEDGK